MSDPSMSLPARTRLGPYELVARLGAGGMGTVYRARDTRLDRSVAIKVLAPHLSATSELRGRFEREARAISALNHPHICTLHDVGHQDGVDYLVMEYVEGQTIVDRLAKGPLPVDQVLRLGIQIADALDKAHRRGIVHRDLKPGNVMLTRTGAKLLDFGLAKLSAAPEAPDPTLSALPTLERPLTGEGRIVGTLQYMAPEQLEGSDVDARTDIFALGSLLYEMASGRRAFTGKTQASLIGAILKDDSPSLASIQPLTPWALDRLVRTCLAKDPDDRYQAAHDVMLELNAIADAPGQSGSPAMFGQRAGKYGRLPWAVAAFAVVAALASGFAAWRSWRATASTPRPLIHFAIQVPPDQPFLRGRDFGLALSPDGLRLVYTAGLGEKRQLYSRPMDQLAASPLSGTQGAEFPFFSPDGEWVGFFAAGKLKKVPIRGGAPIVLADAEQGRGGAWGSDGTIVFTPSTQAGLLRVPSAGGPPQPLTQLNSRSGQSSHRWPDFLPDGKTVLFTSSAIGRSWDEARIEAVSLVTGERRVVLEGATSARYVPSGQLIFIRAGSLLAVPFDVRRSRVMGPPEPVLDGIMTSLFQGGAQLAVSRSGSLAHILGPPALPDRHLVWVDRTGTAQPLGDAHGAFTSPQLSPDGRRVALSTVDPGRDIWIYDIVRGTLSRLTIGASPGAVPGGAEILRRIPAWSPDGKWVAFAAEKPGVGSALFRKLADGSAAEEPLMKAQEHPQSMGSWSPDGRQLVFTRHQPPNGWDVWMLPLAGDRVPRPLLAAPHDERSPRLSPDGRWLAYVSNESGRDEVYVRPFPDPGGRLQISSAGGAFPVWARSGRELFYRKGDRSDQMMAVELTTQPALVASAPRLLFEADYAPPFDVSPDGQRFLMLRDAEPAAQATQINVVLNRFDEPSRRVRGESR